MHIKTLQDRSGNLTECWAYDIFFFHEHLLLDYKLHEGREHNPFMIGSP